MREFAIQGYQIFQGHQHHRGVITYVEHSLQLFLEDCLSDMAHEEQIWCVIWTKRGSSILIGNIYHIPSSGQQNHEEPNRLIQEACKLGHTAAVIMGDFNILTIDLDTWNEKNRSGLKFHIDITGELPSSRYREANTI